MQEPWFQDPTGEDLDERGRWGLAATLGALPRALNKCRHRCIDGFEPEKFGALKSDHWTCNMKLVTANMALACELC